MGKTSKTASGVYEGTYAFNLGVTVAVVQCSARSGTGRQTGERGIIIT